MDRNIERAKSRRIKRWKSCVQSAISTIEPDIFSSQEVGDLLLGSLTEAKRACRRGQRRQLFTFPRLVEPDRTIGTNESVIVGRPTRILSLLNRSHVFPSLVPIETAVQEASVSRIVEILSCAVPFMSPHRLLDTLATASGFSWDDSAAILLASGLISTALAPEIIAATREARNFWKQYPAGQERFSNLVANGVMANLAGKWGVFEHDELEQLLPGIIVPTRLRRHDYLTNAIHAGGEFCLDVHAGLDVRPLFRHPFPNAFSPLHYGQPRCRVPG